MKTALLTLLVILHLSLFSQSTYQHWQWAKSFGGTGKDTTTDIKIKNGYLYVTGNFTSSTINWDGTILTNNGGSDIFVAKMDTLGNTIWVKNFGGTGDDSVTQLEINDNSTIALLCKSNSTIINIGSNTLNNPYNFYAELDKDGNILKANSLPSQTYSNDIAIDAAGSIYLACSYTPPFTFAGTIIDTTLPPKPSEWPTSYTISNLGYAVMKYKADGSAYWIKTFRGLSGNGLSIEYNNADTSILALFSHTGNVVFNQTPFFDNASSELGNPTAIFAAKIAIDSTIKFAGSFLSNGYHSITLEGFKIGDQGHSSILTLGSSLSFTYTNLSIYDTKDNLINSTAWNLNYPTGPSIYTYDLNTSENGDLTMLNAINNTTDTNSIIVLDTGLTQLRNIVIPESNRLSTLLRCMNNNSGIYLGDSFTGDSLVLNTGVPSANTITLKNNGIGNIFVGKFSLGFKPLSLKPFKDTIKICNGIQTTNLDSSILLATFGAGNLKYHWEPAISFSNPDSLNSQLLMQTDTLYSTLTITDAQDNSITTPVVFYKGVNFSLSLKISDTAICQLKNVSISLNGDNFTPCEALLAGYPSDKYIFTSLTDQGSLFLLDSGINKIQLLPLPNSNTCTLTDTFSINVLTYPARSKDDTIKVCRGSNYTFPDGTISSNIQQNTFHDSQFYTIHGCDSSFFTYLLVADSFSSLTNITLYSGSNYTFPDNTSINNIQANMSQVSYLKSTGGCDSIVTTNISVMRSHNSTEIYSVCSGSSYTFPDGTSFTNIKNDTSHTSYLISINGIDTVITNITAIPVYSKTENAAVCGGCVYTLPDGTIYTNQADTTIISILKSVTGCDSSIITHISTCHIFNTTLVFTVCKGSSFTFPDGTTTFNVQPPFVTHLSNLHGPGIECDSFITTTLNVVDMDTSVSKTNAVLQSNLSNANYQWLNCADNSLLPFDTAQSFTATIAGSYAVQLSLNGCVDTSACYVISANDLVQHRPSDINLYPVPAKGSLTIAVQSKVSANLSISLYDSYGREVLTNTVKLLPGNNTTTLSTSSLAAGIYTLKLYNDGTQETTSKSVVVD